MLPSTICTFIGLQSLHSSFDFYSNWRGNNIVVKMLIRRGERRYVRARLSLTEPNWFSLPISIFASLNIMFLYIFVSAAITNYRPIAKFCRILLNCWNLLFIQVFHTFNVTIYHLNMSCFFVFLELNSKICEKVELFEIIRELSTEQSWIVVL